MSNFSTSEVEGWIKDWPVEYRDKGKGPVDKVVDGVYAVSILGILPIGGLFVAYRVLEFIVGAL